MKVYGLTGAPGCGKSTVLSIFGTCGWKCLDADSVCRRLHETPGGELHRAMRERWGAEILEKDGTTCRAETARRVFADGAERAWLEERILPLAHAEALRTIAAFPEDSRVMFEVPLLFEKGWNSGLAGTIAVWSDFEIRMARLLKRGWSREHALARMNSQFSAEKKLELAEYGIINSGSLGELEKQCLELNLQLQEK